MAWMWTASLIITTYLGSLTGIVECAFTLEHAHGHNVKRQFSDVHDGAIHPPVRPNESFSGSTLLGFQVNGLEHEKGGDFTPRPTTSLPISSPRGVGRDISTGLRRYIGNQLRPSQPALAHSRAHSSNRVGEDQFLSEDLGMTPSSTARGSKVEDEAEEEEQQQLKGGRGRGGRGEGPSDRTPTMTATTRKKLKHFQLKFRDLTPWQDYKVSAGSASSGNQINPTSTKDVTSHHDQQLYYAQGPGAIHRMAQNYAYPESNGLSQTDRDYFRMIRTENGFTDLRFYNSHLGVPGNNRASSSQSSHQTAMPISNSEHSGPLNRVAEINLKDRSENSPTHFQRQMTSPPPPPPSPLHPVRSVGSSHFQHDSQPRRQVNWNKA
ncbi:hypothetical protein TCAL_16158 [Tigriopus californicus]|uniref:Uncharacterized protein n=1 Tax=Tigriopus californicus TaxID=6832 RepID=A0A553P3X3_TIGCA|nr:hypothetical protein TCAL_16158 [Tigriopus californicus]